MRKHVCWFVALMMLAASAALIAGAATARAEQPDPLGEF